MSTLLSIVFLSFITISSAKFIGLPDIDYNEIDHKSSSEEIDSAVFNDSEKSENLWTVDLNDNIDSLKLRRGTKLEEKDFDMYTGPLIDDYFLRKQRLVVKKDTPKPATAQPLNVTKEDIFKYLNKFSLYSKTEPDAYLSDSHEDDEPSIAIFFKGGFSSLIVSIGMRQWHYFVAPSSSIQFPKWFYLDHHGETQNTLRDVPNEVRNELYPVLYRLLQLVLTHPL